MITRRLLVLPVAAALAAGSVLVAQPASAAAVKYANCTALHASHSQFKGGVARKGAKDKRTSGHATYKPYVSDSWYNANKSLDRDKDGIACEQ